LDFLVDRVLSFFSSRRNWDPLTGRRVCPLFDSEGTHSLAGNGYISNSKEDSREATTPGKPTTAGRPEKAWAARNVGNTSSKRDLNSSREGSNSRDSSHGRDSRDETTSIRTHQ
jgi:hypothetical protein